MKHNRGCSYGDGKAHKNSAPPMPGQISDSQSHCQAHHVVFLMDAAGSAALANAAGAKATTGPVTATRRKL